MIVKEYHHGITPFAFVVVIGWIVFGSLLMISSMFFGDVWEFSTASKNVPDVIEALMGIFILSGSIFMLSAARGKTTIRQALKWEYVGLTLAAAGWIAYAVGSFSEGSYSPAAPILGVTFAIAALARMHGTWTYEKKMRKPDGRKVS